MARRSDLCRKCKLGVAKTAPSVIFRQEPQSVRLPDFWPYSGPESVNLCDSFGLPKFWPYSERLQAKEWSAARNREPWPLDRKISLYALVFVASAAFFTAADGYVPY